MIKESQLDDATGHWIIEEGGPGDGLAGVASWVARTQEQCYVNGLLGSGLAGI